MTKKVRIALLQKNLTIEAVARQLGRSGKTKGWVSQVLSGIRAGKNERKQIADILGKTEEWLAREITKEQMRRARGGVL